MTKEELYSEGNKENIEQSKTSYNNNLNYDKRDSTLSLNLYLKVYYLKLILN